MTSSNPVNPGCEEHGCTNCTNVQKMKVDADGACAHPTILQGRSLKQRPLITAHLTETRTTVDGLSAAWYEWDSRLLTTTGARHPIINTLAIRRSGCRSSPFRRLAHLRLTRLAASRTTYRLIHKAFGGVKLLFSRCKDEIHPAIPTGQGFVCEAHGSLLL
jgi:hypothetical protein